MEILTGIIAIFIALNFLAISHELAHYYYFMRRYGVPVKEIGFFVIPIKKFGIKRISTIFTFKFKSGLKLAIGWLPIVAYVISKNDNEDIELLKPYQKLLIYSSGVSANFITGFILFLTYLFITTSYTANSNVMVWILNNIHLAFVCSLNNLLLFFPTMAFGIKDALSKDVIETIIAFSQNQSAIIGPLEIFRILYRAFLKNHSLFLLIVGYISIMMACLNLLPFSVLDGLRTFKTLFQEIWKNLLYKLTKDELISESASYGHYLIFKWILIMYLIYIFKI